MLALPPSRRYIAAMPNLLLVMLGGAFGAGARHLAGVAGLRWLGPGFPWPTLFVNLAGSLLMGLLAGWLVQKGGSEQARLFFGVGVLGGFTTFSAFSLQTLDLMRAGALYRAGLNVGVSVVLCIVAVAIGHALAAHYNESARSIAQIDIEEA